MPITATDAGKGTEIVVTAVEIFTEDFFDSFFGGGFGAENNFTSGTAFSQFGSKGGFMSFPVHNALSFMDI